MLRQDTNSSEMSRRVESICSKVLGAKAGIMTDALTWAGTFHAIGAKLLREYAEQIDLQPNFTIHDREDSADLMNLFRHQLGFSQTESRFPTKGTCLSIYSRAVNAEMPLEAVLQEHFPWCTAWEAQLLVLPDPAPAMTSRGTARPPASPPTPCSTACRCSVFSLAR